MLEIIGAGYRRTGTVSLKAALERLGSGPCYHAARCCCQVGTIA
ncbi:MAG: hypothetical protein JOZ19_12460 [Rubrobacter sp.]|nr:hypothetical protein [Rubrobacter sp.]